MRANSNHNSKFGRYDLDAENVMAISDIESGEIIEVSPLGAALDRSRISAQKLVKTASMEVVRLVVPAGKDVANHTAPGEVTVQCLEGVVDFTIGTRTQRLTAGRLLHVPMGTVHAVHGIEDASILVTIVRCDAGGRDAG
jgi:quercetin dioxygenase-like cupin family protein